MKTTIIFLFSIVLFSNSYGRVLRADSTGAPEIYFGISYGTVDKFAIGQLQNSGVPGLPANINTNNGFTNINLGVLWGKKKIMNALELGFSEFSNPTLNGFLFYGYGGSSFGMGGNDFTGVTSTLRTIKIGDKVLIPIDHRNKLYYILQANILYGINKGYVQTWTGNNDFVTQSLGCELETGLEYGRRLFGAAHVGFRYLQNEVPLPSALFETSQTTVDWSGAFVTFGLGYKFKFRRSPHASE